MKKVKFFVSVLSFLGILVLLVWAGIRANREICTDISVKIHGAENSLLLTKSDILNILKQNNIEWKKKSIKEIDESAIHKILAQENYIKSVDKVHFLGSKLQIEVSLYNILLEVQPYNGTKFLIDINGIYLPYSPRVENDVIVVQGNIPNYFHNKETVSTDTPELNELFTVASLIKSDPMYAALFHKLSINDKHEITFYPSIGKLPVVFGTIEDAPSKLKTLKYMYEEVLPYMREDKYTKLDVRFKNRVVATKS
jgi:cell division protein FtsQ